MFLYRDIEVPKPLRSSGSQNSDLRRSSTSVHEHQYRFNAVQSSHITEGRDFKARWRRHLNEIRSGREAHETRAKFEKENPEPQNKILPDFDNKVLLAILLHSKIRNVDISRIQIVIGVTYNREPYVTIYLDYAQIQNVKFSDIGLGDFYYGIKQVINKLSNLYKIEYKTFFILLRANKNGEIVGFIYNGTTPFKCINFKDLLFQI